MEITSTAWAAGLAGALLYLILAWPLAKALAFTRVLFVSFHMKLLAAVVIGAVCAPLGESYAPAIRDTAERWISKSKQATSVYNELAEFLK